MQQETEIELVKRRQYSDREKAEALALLDANGGNLYRTAQELNIPRTSLQQWAQGQGISADVPLLRHQKTLEYGTRFGELMEMILDSVTPEDLARASLKDKFISAAVAFDKRQLAYGEATQIHGQADSYQQMAERVYKRALERGEDVTLEMVKLRIVERKPEARQYLLPEGNAKPS